MKNFGDAEEGYGGHRTCFGLIAQMEDDRGSLRAQVLKYIPPSQFPHYERAFVSYKFASTTTT